MKDNPLVVAFGGGVNSVAMLVGLHERHIRPDLIIFSDTKAEKPETYRTIEQVNHWLNRLDWPGITTVSNVTSVDASLEASVLKLKTLPPIAFGFKTCSQRWKARPQNAFVEQWATERGYWNQPTKIVKAVGYDSGELHRVRDIDDPHYVLRYFLVEWVWYRSDCIEAIQRAGLSVPMKSSCFFCPASKKKEVLWLRDNHPDLFKRAVEIERNAADNMDVIRGLGRHWSWEEIAKADEQQFKMFPDLVQTPCMCFDGEEEATS